MYLLVSSSRQTLYFTYDSVAHTSWLCIESHQRRHSRHRRPARTASGSPAARTPAYCRGEGSATVAWTPRPDAAQQQRRAAEIPVGSNARDGVPSVRKDQHDGRRSRRAGAGTAAGAGVPPPAASRRTTRPVRRPATRQARPAAAGRRRPRRRDRRAAGTARPVRPQARRRTHRVVLHRLRARRRRAGGCRLQARRKTSVPLVPPKPKLFFTATSIFISRAVLATKSVSHSGSRSTRLIVGGDTGGAAPAR